MNTIKVNRKDLSKFSSTPTFTECRRLIQEGVDPNTRLEVYRDRAEPDIIIPNIGKAAKLGVAEDPNVRFVKFDPPKQIKYADR